MFFIRIVHHGGTESTEKKCRLKIAECRFQIGQQEAKTTIDRFNLQFEICNLQFLFPLRVLRDSVVMTLKH